MQPLASTPDSYNANPDTPARAYSTIAHIDLGQLERNARLIKKLASPAEVMAVVKANAYGHGVIEVAKTLHDVGYNQFMVATLSEALHLRKHGINDPILVAMPSLEPNLPVYTQENLLVSVSNSEVCSAILGYAPQKQKLSVHIKVDTGMHRLGLTTPEAQSFIRAIAAYPNIELQGIWTHLATAGAKDTSFAKKQISIARSLLEGVPEFNGVFHVGNSSSLLHQERYLIPSENSMYRVGGGLLGISALPERAQEIGLKTIMTLKSHVLSTKFLAAGETVSYGRRWAASRDTTIAIVGAGYADGYPCTLPNAQTQRIVSINGEFYPVIGSICMDMFMIELGANEKPPLVQTGDEVILFGNGGPSINDIARESGKKAYEISCSISQRVVRKYF